MPKTIWLIRHAENSKDEAAGLGLTEEGKQSTKSMAGKIAGVDSSAPAIIFTSPVLRGIETGQILRDEFCAASKNAVHRSIVHLAARDTNDFVNLLHMLKTLDNDPALPQSVILVGHKQNEALQIIAALLDPEGYATDYRIDETARRPAEKLYELLAMEDSDLAILYPQISRPIKEYSFLEAMKFHYLPEKWADFDAACGRHVQTLSL